MKLNTIWVDVNNKLLQNHYEKELINLGLNLEDHHKRTPVNNGMNTQMRASVLGDTEDSQI